MDRARRFYLEIGGSTPPEGAKCPYAPCLFSKASSIAISVGKNEAYLGSSESQPIGSPMDQTKHSSHFPDCFYRVTIKGLYVKDGKVLFTRDFTHPLHKESGGELELPGGGLDFGEDMHDALRREVREEMGLEVASISDQPVFIWTENHGPGRTMDWYYVCVVVFKIDLKNLDFTPSDECRELIFLSLEEMRARMPEMALQIQPIVKFFKPEDFV